MALRNWSGFSAADGAVSADLVFDDATLLIDHVTYQNLTGSDARCVVDDNGTDRSFLLPANTPAGTQTSLRALNYHMTTGTQTHLGQTTTYYNLPAGVSLSWQYPA